MGDDVEATRILSPLNENHYLKEAPFSIELARVMELADIADLKSAATIGVRVRPPSRAPQGEDDESCDLCPTHVYQSVVRRC